MLKYGDEKDRCMQVCSVVLYCVMVMGMRRIDVCRFVVLYYLNVTGKYGDVKVCSVVLYCVKAMGMRRMMCASL